MTEYVRDPQFVYEEWNQVRYVTTAVVHCPTTDWPSCLISSVCCVGFAPERMYVCRRNSTIWTSG